MSTTTAPSTTTGLQSADVESMMASQSHQFEKTLDTLMQNNNQQMNTLQNNVNANNATMMKVIDGMQTQMYSQGTQFSNSMGAIASTMNNFVNSMGTYMMGMQKSSMSNMTSYLGSSQNGQSNQLFSIT